MGCIRWTSTDFVLKNDRGVSIHEGYISSGVSKSLIETIWNFQCKCHSCCVWVLLVCSLLPVVSLTLVSKLSKLAKSKNSKLGFIMVVGIVPQKVSVCYYECMGRSDVYHMMFWLASEGLIIRTGQIWECCT